jgi:3-methyladenine DNA glycosylase AlkC
MPDIEAPSFELKDWFNSERYQSIAKKLAAINPKFEASLPVSFRVKVKVLRELAPQIEHNFVAIFLSDFVARYGLDDPVFSLNALRDFTRVGSAEFAVRHFLVRDLEATLATMQVWTRDSDEHVRRLASEGSRPRLPWGLRLQSLVRDPSPLGPILDALNSDGALYVRKSVANSLNDITKDHPEWVLSRLQRWDLTHLPTAWIAKRACRTLIKRGHGQTLALFGFDGEAAAEARFKVTPRKVKLGDLLTLEANLVSAFPKQQRLAVDYVIHYRKANGRTSPKVFKWREVDLAPNNAISLIKRQVIRDFTTRTHFRGRHVVELQINGRKTAAAFFDLVNDSRNSKVR